MIYKNDSSKEKMYVNKYRTRKLLTFGFAIFFNFIVFYIVLPHFRPDFEKTKNVLLITFLALACYCTVLVFLFSKKMKKLYAAYSFEITEDKFIITNNGSVTSYEIKDIKKIEQIRKNQFMIYFNNNTRILTSEFLENQENFNNEISKLHEIKKSSKLKVLNILSWIFCIGFFTSRFIPNIWVFIFFSIGFFIISIIILYQVIFSDSKRWAKIYSVLVYLLIDGMIIYSLCKTFRSLIA